MLRVKSFYARSFSLDYLDLFWTIDDILYKEDDIYAYEFQLFKSESYYGVYKSVTPPFKNIFYYRDPTNLEDHKNRTIYYQLKVRDTRTDESFMVGPTAQITEPDLLALEIIRQADMLFRNFIGRKCYVFPRKTFGPRCICYDHRLQRKNISNCEMCFDTSYLGGFNTPIVTYIQMDPTNRSSQLTPTITHTVNYTRARMISYPSLGPGDIIVDPNNMRWMVMEVSVTSRLSYELHQELQIKEILKQDILYKLPVLDDIKKVNEIYDIRNRTAPQTFEYKERPNYEGDPEFGRI